MTDSIDKLDAMDDNELGETLGHQSELSKFKSILQKVKKLPTHERKKIAATIDSQLKPHVHASGLQYQVEDALLQDSNPIKEE
jgi:hypothetical protein